jgi:hypothetical protein
MSFEDLRNFSYQEIDYQCADENDLMSFELIREVNIGLAAARQDLAEEAARLKAEEGLESNANKQPF